MNLAEVAAGLPNGFHDSQIVSVSMDLVSQVVAMSINVDISTESYGERTYRRLTVVARQVELCFFETPDPAYQHLFGGEPLNAQGDSDLLRLDARVAALIGQVKVRSNIYRFFVEDWNSFFYLASRDVQTSWSS